MTALMLDLDGVLGDTRALWADWLADTSRVLGLDPDVLPDDRGAAAAALDEHAGNWRVLLARYAADRAPVYLRPDAGVSAALRRLGGTAARAPRPRGGARRHPGGTARAGGRTLESGAMERGDLPDRQLDALLERLDRIADRLERIDGRLEAQEGFVQVTRELRALTDSLNAVAYAALGQSPRVRRRAG